MLSHLLVYYYSNIRDLKCEAAREDRIRNEYTYKKNCKDCIKCEENERE